MIEQPPRLSAPPMQGAPAPEVRREVAACLDGYLYWSDVKYRARAAGLEPEELWALVKRERERTVIDVWPEAGIHFSLTNTMLRVCHTCDINFGGSWADDKNFPTDKATQELYLVNSIMEEAIASSQMEGAATTREVAKEMLRRRDAPRDKSQRMILNNYQTIEFIRQHSATPLTPALILELHVMMTRDTLPPDAAGRLRLDDEDIVVGNAITGETIHRPPSAARLPRFLEVLCQFFNDAQTDFFIHPILRAIAVHYLVAYYHPFVDGNGRIARALFYWYMMRQHYPLVQFLSISRAIARSKKSYERAFLTSECDANDMGYFVHYHLRVLEQSFDALAKYLQGKTANKKRAERLLHLGDLSPRQAEILLYYTDSPDLVLEARDVQARLGVSVGTAKADLKDLRDKGYLREIPLNGRTRAYIRGEQLTGGGGLIARVPARRARGL